MSPVFVPRTFRSVVLASQRPPKRFLFHLAFQTQSSSSWRSQVAGARFTSCLFKKVTRYPCFASRKQKVEEMTWAGALMQPKKTQAPSPGTCAPRTLSEGALAKRPVFSDAPGPSALRGGSLAPSFAFWGHSGLVRVRDRRDRSGERPTAPRSSVPGTPLRRRGQLP